jgi:hypothetical protein
MKASKIWLRLFTLCALVTFTTPLFAQGTIQAQVTGGGGSGKCTFEIRTGGTAEVEIRGNQGRVRPVSGGPAQWVRLKCNQPLPMRPNNFRFQGIDGRGRQTLVRDPNSNNGIAVVRIEDNRGGMQGYTGDIMWNGGSGNWNGSGWNDGGGWNGNNGNNGGNWNGNNSGGGWSNNVVSNCQRTIRNQVSSRYNGSVNFNGNPSQKKAGSFVVVDGNARVQARNQWGNINYHCTMHPNGNVADSNFNVTNGNLPGTPQPR